jgi:hypothetical protein
MDLSLATPELRPQCFEIQSLSSISMEVRDKGYFPYPNIEIDGDEGYSPSPNLETDGDKGYSPSFSSISIFWDHNSLPLFSVLPWTRELQLSSLHSS